tara:strand:- start:657 stop:878 length:222 start_codon:yes stop_codon:yes gene_type:complete
MNVERIYKTPLSEITRTMSTMDRTKFVRDIITLFRENPNNQMLGSKVDDYIKDNIGKDQEITVSIMDNWGERD